LKKNGVHCRKNSRVDAYPNRERQHSNKSEPWPLSQHTHGKSDILQQAVEQRKASLLAILFFGLLHAAEFAICGMARRLGGHAAPNIFRNQHFKMRLNFGIKFSLDSLLVEKAV
jgi:hypothetical protein